MEQYEIARDNAVRSIAIADHMLNVTYPLVQDPKLLRFVLKKLFNALEQSILMLLHYERYQKRIPGFTENYHSMLPLLKRVLPRYGISLGYMEFLNDMGDLMIKQQESDVEFVRKDKFVIASREYDLKQFSVRSIKDYVERAKFFIREISGVVVKNGGNSKSKRRA